MSFMISFKVILFLPNVGTLELISLGNFVMKCSVDSLVVSEYLIVSELPLLDFFYYEIMDVNIIFYNFYVSLTSG